MRIDCGERAVALVCSEIHEVASRIGRVSERSAAAAESLAAKKSATRWNRAKSTPKEEGGGDKRR